MPTHPPLLVVMRVYVALLGGMNCGMLGNVILMSDAALSGIDIGPTGGLLAVELWPMKTV